MAFELWTLIKPRGNEPGFYRDRHDRVWVGPICPPVGDGAEYFMDVSNRYKVHEAPVYMDVPKSTLKTDAQASGECKHCGTPLNKKQLKDGRKYCSRTCSNKDK
jgi:hypothetical protein